ncbi:MAG: MarR family transcriptional regulator [Bacillota bacterium]|nr:MarR family transcriptional regulator [Bacillota bacterium]
MQDLNDLWCFRLGSLSRKIYRYYNTHFSEYNITLPQSFVLFDLLKHDGSSIKDIAARVQLDPPAVTNFVDRLVNEDLMLRKEDPSDRRSVKVFLTQNGKDKAKQLLPIAVEFNKQMRNAMKNTDADAFEHALSILEKTL